MIKLKIDNKEFKVPERFRIQQWMNLMKWDFEEVMNHPKIISIATGAPLEQLSQANREAIILGISFIIQAMQQRTPCENGIKNFEDLKFGEWIDLDVYLSMGVDKNLDKFMEILGKDIEFADEALWIIERYTQWRTMVYRNYSVLFGLNEPADEDEETQKKDDKLAVARTWYDILVTLANDDILKIDDVAEKPYKMVLNFMARQKQKQLEENARKLQQRRQYDLSRNRRTL